FSVGIAPILQYGSLDINYNMLGTPSSTKGVAQDFGAGYTVGAAYESAGLTVGASYKSAIDMKYDGQISVAASQFSGGALVLSDNLEQPAEMGVGVSYKMGQHTFAVDYKKIKWSDAKGYKDFKWEDQNVYMFGYQFAQDNWALRAGYNYAKSPIKDQGVATDGGLTNTLNLLGFPAIIEKHYTVGGSYAFTKMTSLDLAYVYSPEKTDTYANMMGGNITTKHSQDAVTAQLNFNF
ncbi:MAG: porin, partial [Sulfuricurvum sp.]|uniref:OmpP1/FadL family transporter n=1 Tax=Sulfuricurvum sp. TaxID=2025608 RepID=UPI0025D09982